MRKVFAGATVFVGPDLQLWQEATLVVDGNRVAEVIDGKPGAFTTGLQVYDCSGLTILPGLVNVHEHLTFKQAGFQARETLSSADSLYGLYAARSARLCLRSGITTVRDMGARNGINLAVKRAVEEGIIPGPRIVASGTPLGISGAHSRRISRPADGPDEVRKAAREIFMAGADFLKVFSSSDPVDIGGEELAAVEYSSAELLAAVDVAHERGKKVAAHSVGRAALRNVLAAGVDSIEHGIYLDEKLAEEVARRGVWLVPTMSGYQQMAEPKWGWPKGFGEMFNRLREPHERSLRVAIKGGVAIAVGSDSNGDMVDELIHLSKAGLPVLDCLKAATMNGARLLGREREIGSIEPGKFADFVLVKGNPMEDVNVLRKPSIVVKDGVVFSIHGRGGEEELSDV